MAAVETHYVELKDKSVLLVEDKGYQVVDDSKWKAELDKFITMVVRPKVEGFIRSRADQAVFHQFATTMVLQLLDGDVFPVSSLSKSMQPARSSRPARLKSC